jgi:two-component system, OmpR family, sensor histidine kinase KdpD
VCVMPEYYATAMIESGKRNKERFQGDLYVVYIRWPDVRDDENAAMESQLEFAREAGATTQVLESDDPIKAIIEFAREKRITQIFVGHGSHENWRDRLFGDPVLRLIRATEGIDVRVFPG